ncbi:MAG: M48 family metallopeptidase [Verrucomicrobiales bacterium]
MNSGNSLNRDSFTGGAFAPGNGSKVLKGEIVVQSGSLNFTSGEKQVSLPITGMTIRGGGYNDSQIFFEHPNHPGWVIYSTEREILQHPSLTHLVDKKVANSSARTHRRFVTLALGSIVLVLGLFILGVGLLVMQKDAIVRAVADKVPVKTEIEYGEKIFQSMKGEWTFVTDSEMTAKLAEVTNKFEKVIAASAYPFKFHVIQNTNINAFALPGGNIVVHDELIKRFGSADAIAGVIAHEMAHVTERHSLRKIIESSGLYLLLQAFLGDAEMMVAIFRDGSRLLLERKFSRSFEREADNKGWDYMIEAGIDPSGMVDGFKKLKTESEKAGQESESGAWALLSTHGSIDERIRNLEKKLENQKIIPGK